MKVPIPPRARKTLGQNFLHDENILRKIVSFSKPSRDDTFVEIGAGTGALTRLLAPHVGKLIAIEVDQTLLPYLSDIPGIEILAGDIRKIDLSTLTEGKKLRIIGNLPYYISTTILTSLISQRSCIQDMVLMFQEEVAARILAPPSDSEYGLLSVLAQYFCRIERGFRISRNCFSPKPDVQSRILHFSFRSDPLLRYDEFFSFLRQAFSQRRKKLRSSLLRTLPVSPQQLDQIFQKVGIPENTRAENLSAEQYEHLILATTHQKP